MEDYKFICPTCCKEWNDSRAASKKENGTTQYLSRCPKCGALCVKKDGEFKILKRDYEELFQQYLWSMRCNGDIFAEYWRPFTYEEWVRNGKPIEDGGVKLDDNTEHLVTFRY